MNTYSAVMSIISSNETVLKDMYGQVIEKLKDIELEQGRIKDKLNAIEQHFNERENDELEG